MALLKTLAALLVIQVTSAQYEGAIINIEQLPFYVLVETITASGSKFWCSGALVNNKYVITNAHCLYRFDSNKPNVIVGGNSHVDKKAKIISTNETFIHTDYKFDTDENDVAAVRLNWNVEFSSTVKGVDLLKTDEINLRKITLVGYRRESSGGPKVRYYEVVIKNPDVCHYDLKETYSNIAPLNESRFCLSDTKYYRVQHGDILFQKHGSSAVLTGLVSRNKTFITRVSLHHDKWIDGILNDTFPASNVETKNVSITEKELYSIFRYLFKKSVNYALKYIDIPDKENEDGTWNIYTVNPEAYQIPTIKSFLSMYQKYYAEPSFNKTVTESFLNDQNLLIETLINTTEISTVMRYLIEKGLIKNNVNDFKDSLRNLWFGPDHTFKTVFIENRLPSYSVIEYETDTSFSNWIIMDDQNKKGRLVCRNKYTQRDLRVTRGVLIKYICRDTEKTPQMYEPRIIVVGLPPELEIALYTICAYVNPYVHCNVLKFIKTENYVTYLTRYPLG